MIRIARFEPSPMESLASYCAVFDYSNGITWFILRGSALSFRILINHIWAAKLIPKNIIIIIYDMFKVLRVKNTNKKILIVHDCCYIYLTILDFNYWLSQIWELCGHKIYKPLENKLSVLGHIQYGFKYYLQTCYVTGFEPKHFLLKIILDHLSI